MWSQTNSLISRLLILVLLTAALAGCGFHMRGKTALPPELEQISISGLEPYEALVISLSRFLRANGVEVVPLGTPDVAELRLSNLRQNKEILVVGTDGRVREYRLFTSVTMAMQEKEMGLVLPSEVVVVRRDFLYNPDDVLGKAEEERVLREEMTRDLAQKVLERLGSLIR